MLRLRHHQAQQITAGLTAFFSVSQEWHLSHCEQRALLGSPDCRTFKTWKKNLRGRLPLDTLDRLSFFIGIYRMLNLLFKEDTIFEWLRNTNRSPIFKGHSPLDYMMREGLVAISDVYRYLNHHTT